VRVSREGKISSITGKMQAKEREKGENKIKTQINGKKK
jgi:hypothetical protein